MNTFLPPLNPPPLQKVALGLLRLLAVWGVVMYAAVTAFVLSNQPSRDARWILLEGAGLILIWCVGAGAGMAALRGPLTRWIRRVPLPWGLRFFLLCTLLAMIEEGVTTSLSSAAVRWGQVSPAGIITASTNYWEVIFLHSVIVFLPMFAVWVWMLRRWDFSPVEVMLLFGLSGTLGETLSFGTQNLSAVGMWVFVYGWMVWLPAYSLPAARGQAPVRFWHWPMAVLLPLAASVPWTVLVLWLQGH